MTDPSSVKYRNAILWAIDYFDADRLTEKERATGVKELCQVLLGRSSRAATYIPNDWDKSAKLAKRDEPDWDHRGDNTPLNFFKPLP